MLQRVATILSGLAFVGMGAGVALAINIAQGGALNTRPGGISAQGDALVSLLSAANVLGLALLIIAAGCCIALAVRRGQWPWAVALALLTVGGLYAAGNAGFNADVLSGVLSLVAPLACLIFAATYHPVVRQHARLS